MNKKFITFIAIVVVFFLSVYVFVRNGSKDIAVETVFPTPESTTVEISDEEKIKMILDNKYSLDPETTSLSIMENTGQYAKGGYGTITPQGGGGLWFAAKKDGQWDIVYDGNGIITCDKLDGYPNYPTDLIPECWDLSSNAMVER